MQKDLTLINLREIYLKKEYIKNESSPIQTFTVGSGITPDQPFGLRANTAGRDSHPASKIY